MTIAPGEVALHRPLPIGTGVDKQGTGCHRGPCLVRVESPHSDPGLPEHRVHSGRRCRHAMILPRGGGIDTEIPGARPATERPFLPPSGRAVPWNDHAV
jgi:hypothetical protein